MEAIQKPKKQSKKKKNLEKSFKQIDPSYSEFKQAEKKYRLYKDYITDFSSLLDFSISNIDISKLPIQKLNIKGTIVYKFDDPEGVYLIKDFLNIPEQLNITLKCLNEYHKKPYRTNLFIYEGEEEKKQMEKIQEKIVKNEENKFDSEETSNLKDVHNGEKTGNDEKNENLTEKEKNSQKNEENQNIQKNEKQENSLKKDYDPYLEDKSSEPYNKERFYINDFSRYCFDRKIRWSNVGYQYDWNNRTYPAEKTSLPIDLLNLSEKTKEFLKEVISDVFDYKAESTIINYYDSKNFMGGHLDDGEKDQKHPIFSYSFGLSCVFLMGGKTKDVKPWAIKLDSGICFIVYFFILL